ncbi:MAG: undecaprenyl diphosphate synthase [Candidatus Sumerlaeota bacterium]|nr:undecaprenyl diphosphate synthase [Candidatus Sumerlaeota bacterium]
MSMRENTAGASAIRLLEPVTPDEQAVFERLDLQRLPRHVAVIMDGNGRWARQRSLPERIDGHRAGIDAVRAATRTAAQLRLDALTLYSFSTENWSRPKTEVTALMSLLETFLIKEIPELNDNNIRLVASGQIEDLPKSARNKLAHTMEATASNTGLVLNLALSYGGRQEIVLAVRRAMQEAAEGRTSPEEMTAERFGSYLYHPELGDPELLLRTSGEMRVSNFLLWQIAYTEFVYLPVLWPDFRRVHFLEAIAEYQHRDRRFGGVR